MKEKVNHILVKLILLGFAGIIVIQSFVNNIYARSYRDYNYENGYDSTLAAEHGAIPSTSKTVMPYVNDFYVKYDSAVEIYRSIQGVDFLDNDGITYHNMVKAGTRNADKTWSKTLSDGQYYVWYRKIGKYKSQYLDIKVTLETYNLFSREYAGDSVNSNGVGRSENGNTAYVCLRDDTGLYGIATNTHDLKYEFYKHDDNITVSNGNLSVLEKQERQTNLKGFYTITDVDGDQGVLFKDRDKIENCYVTNGNHKLKFANADEGLYFFDCSNINEKDKATGKDKITYDTYVTALFDTGNTNSLRMVYKFPNGFCEMGSSETKLIPTAIPNLTKTVTDSNENEVTTNTLMSSNEEYTYNIKHQVPFEPSEFYYKSYTITDELSDGLDLVKVDIVDEFGNNCSSYFNVQKTGNTVTISSTACKNKAFYYKTYTFKIRVKISDRDKVLKYYNGTGKLELHNTAKVKVLQPKYGLPGSNDETYDPYIPGNNVYTEETRQNNPQTTTEIAVGKIKAIKKDSETNEAINGAKIGIYSNMECTQKVAELNTKDDGTDTTGLLDIGTYYAKEIQAPNNYVLDTQVYPVRILTAGQTVEVEVKNRPNTATVKVAKLDNQTNKIVTKSDTSFALYEWSVSKNTWELATHVKSETLNGKTPDGTAMLLKEETTGTKGTYTGKIYYNAQNDGKFRIVEYSRPFGYTTSNWQADVQITEDGQVFTYTTEIKNNEVKAKINFKKNDSEVNYNNQEYEESYAQGDATIEGAQYGLYAKENILSPDDGGIIYRQGSLIESKSVDATGKVTWENLYLGKYYIQEITPSKGYLKDTKQYEVDLEKYYRDNYYSTGDQTTDIIIYQNTEADSQYSNTEKRVISKEKVMKQGFQLTKLSLAEDSTMGEPLQGAGFKIYLIKDLSKVKDGTIKPDIDGNYNAKDFKKYDFTNELTALNFKDNADGVRIGELYTNEDGILVSPELAYGKYVVVESKVPENHIIVNPFIVEITEDSRNPKKMVYPIDREFYARIKIVKRDDTTNRVVLKPDAAYRIWSITKNQYIEQWITYPNKVLYGTENNPYKTSDKGYLLTPEILEQGEYELIEVEAPNGYVLAGKEAENQREHVRFTISTNNVYEIDEDLGTQNAIITVEQKNSQQLGTITVSKQGEFLSNVQNQEDIYNFGYELRPVTDATFAIYAKEDIYTQDNQVDESGERYKVYTKDQLIRKVQTNEEGKAIFEKVPLGKYYIKEIIPGEGFVLNSEQKDIELTYEGQEKAIIYRQTGYTNERQKIKISVTKRDRETNQILQGAEFGLYTKEAISYIDSSKNQRTVPANILVAKAVSRADGIATFQDENLPLGQYYIKELKGPRGYSTTSKIVDVDCSYKGGNIDTIIKEVEFTNLITKLKIKVTDYETEEDLVGTEITLRDESGNTIGKYTIDENGEVLVEGLEVGKQYSIEENKQRKGYVKDLLFKNNESDPNELTKGKEPNGKITFTIRDTEEVQKVTLSNLAKVGQIEIEKDGEVLIGTEKDENGNIVFKYEKQKIDTAKFEIYAKEDIIHPDGKQGIIVTMGTKIAEGQTKNGILLVTNYSNELIEQQPEIIQSLLNRGLPLGEYEIKETEAPKGYFYKQEEQTKTVRVESLDDASEIEKYKIIIDNPRQSTNIGKQRPEIKIEKQAEKQVYKIGEEVIYKIRITNTGNTILKDVEVKETMLNGAFADVETEGIVKKDNNTVVIERLEIGESRTLEYNYQIQEDYQGKIDNKVTATATPVKKVVTPDGEEVEEQISEKIVDDDNEKVWVGDEQIEKTAEKEIYTPGEIVEYTLNVMNPNDEPIENAKVEDSKVTVGSIISASKEGINVTEDGIITIGKIEAREAIEIVYKYQIPDNWIGNLSNTATLNGTINMKPIEPKEATKTVEVKESGIDITKEPEKTTYKKGEIINYTIKVTNIGKTVLKNVKIEEKLLNGKFLEKTGINLVNDQTVIIDKLEIGEIVKLTYQYTIGQERLIGEKIKNRVTVTGEGQLIDPEDPDNIIIEQVTDEDQKDVVVIEDNNTPDKELGLYKTDIETKEAISGVTFGLYAGEDIIGKDNTVLIPKDTLIEKVKTNIDGYARFTADLPIGKFYILEIEPKAGYIKNNQKIEVDSTKIEETEREYQVKLQTQNKKTEINIEKIEKTEELETRMQITGSKLQILDTENNIVEEWITDGNPHNIKGLETEKQYKLHEVEPAKGYVTTKDIEFSINTDGSLKIENIYTIEDSEIPTIIMQDDITRVKVDIVDKETKEPVKDVVVEIVDKETGEVVEEFVTDGEEHIIEKLPIGEYEIREKDYPKDEGYVSIEPEDLTVKDTPEIQEKVVEQDFTKLDVSFVDEVTKKLLPGGKLELRNKEGEIVASIDNTGIHYYKERLPAGEYTLVEVEVPEGYEPSENIKFTLEDTPEIQYVVMENKRLPFDLKVEKYASEIAINGVKQAGVKQEGQVAKVDIIGSKISKQNVQITYTIKVLNVGKVAGSVGKITDKIPSGLTFNANKNQSYWVNNGNNTITTTKFEERKIQPGESIELTIVLDWAKNEFNFGSKINNVTIGELKNNPGFEDENPNNNSSNALILLSIKTGYEIVLTKQIMVVVLSAIIAIGIIAAIEIKILTKKEK